MVAVMLNTAETREPQMYIVYEQTAISKTFNVPE